MAEITQMRQFLNSEKGVSQIRSRDIESATSNQKFLMEKNPVTGDYPVVDNANPYPALKFLIPVSIAPLSIQEHEAVKTSHQILQMAQSIGFLIEHYELGIYTKSKQGRPRRLNNSDLATNYGSLYGSPSSALSGRLELISQTRSDLIQFTKLIMAKAESFSEPVKMDEHDDAGRLTMQRTQYYGRFLSPPASADLIDVKYPKRFLEIVDIIAHQYISTTEARMPNRIDAMGMLVDAQETAIGAPSYASSGINSEQMGYHEKRLITLSDMPTPDYTLNPEEYLNMCYQWGEQLGLPNGAMALSSAISYRQGAKGHKPQNLWYFDGDQFVSKYEAMSWESNQRLVFPAPHCLNVLISAIVYQMKEFRKSKLGLFHTPEQMALYIPKLNAQGSISYESDFSSYDTTISNSIMQYVMERLAHYSRKYNWEYNLFKHYLATTGVIYPSFLTDESRNVTFFQGAVSLLSGILPTSEIGSIVSLSANLYALEKQIPNIVNDWIHGKFIILVQSDDVLFTLPKKVNEDVFSDAMKELSLTAKLKEGNMFLKKLLPVGTLSKYQKVFPIAGVPLWSRQPQQTFFNENDLDGKPDAILRLALLSRSEGLNHHPMFDKVLDAAWKDVLHKFPVFHEILPNLYSGVLSLSEEDKQTILKYSTSDSGMAWLSKIYSRIDSDPKAKELFMEMMKLGFDLNQFEDTAASQRRMYIKALFSNPNGTTREMMFKILAWNSD